MGSSASKWKLAGLAVVIMGDARQQPGRPGKKGLKSGKDGGRTGFGLWVIDPFLYGLI
jgi:hypothetical protein